MSKMFKIKDGQSYEYEIYPLVDYIDPALKTACTPFDFANPPVDPKYLAVSLLETMVTNAGVGLSANQCGFNYRLFVMGVGNFGVTVFNPEILEKSESENPMSEGCLSFPGLFLKIRRADSIRVRFWDMNGEEQTTQFEGLTARIFLHEYDHMQGELFTNLVSPIALSLAREKIKGNLKRMKKYKEEAKKQIEASRQKAAEAQVIRIDTGGGQAKINV